MTKAFEEWWKGHCGESQPHTRWEAWVIWNAATSQSANCEPKHELCFETFEEYWEVMKEYDNMFHYEQLSAEEKAKRSFSAARLETGAVITTNDEPAVYGGQMYILKQVGADEYLTFDGVCFYLNGGRHVAAEFPKHVAEQRKDRWNKRGATMLEVVPVPTKKKSIDLSDFDKIRHDQNKKLDKLYDPNATEPTMELRHDADLMRNKCVLQQYHRYLNKTGGEWRDVPTV